MKTNVYVDGFNLYYGCYQDDRHPEYRRYKWLHLRALLERALPNDDIHRIRYFTAVVSGSANDPDKPVRQRAFIRALRTVPNLTVHEGIFLTTRKTGRVVTPQGIVTQALQRVEVREEKGSDVNLATHLLTDAFDDDFEMAVIVSNDSDLVGPIEVVRGRFGRRVGVLNPQSGYSGALYRAATFYKRLPKAELANCQFDDPVRDVDGTLIRKPQGW